MPSPWASGTIATLLTVAAVWDAKHRRIPNVIPFALVAIFCVSAIDDTRSDLAMHLESFAVVGGFGLALYMARLWGGGDTKLAAAFALFLKPVFVPRFLLITAIAGGVVAVAVVARAYLNDGKTVTLPYGIAIAAAGLEWCAFG